MPEEVADGRPPFVAQRMDMVRIGDATPINIKLPGGDVLRFVVRHTDAPSRADDYRSQRDPASRKLIRHLRVAE